MSDKETQASKTMKQAEERDPIVREAKDEKDVPKRDSDEFTDQHLKTPKVDPEIEKVANQEEDA